MQRRVIRVLGMYLAGSFILLQVADVTFEPLGFPDWSQTALIVVLLVGIPVVAGFAWVFDVTPDGVVVTDDQTEPPVYSRRAKIIDRSIIVLLAVAVAILVGREVMAPDTPDEGMVQADVDRSLAILPLKSLSSAQDDAYFAVGLTEELTTTLAAIPDLRVISSQSVGQVGIDNRSDGELAEIFGVAHLLKGSVRKSGEDVRIVLQLVRAKDGDVLWSNTFEQELADVFALQDQVAEGVALSLKSALHQQSLELVASTRTSSIEAYDAYLLALHHRSIDWQLVTQYLQEALQKDPEFVPALTFLADVYTNRIGGTLPADRAYPAARVTLETALSLAPEYVPALIVQGKLERLDGDYRAAETAFRKARTLAPGLATTDLANLLLLQGRVDEALREYRHSNGVDPLDPGWYAYALIANGMLDQAIARLETSVPILEGRELWVVYSELARFYALRGDHQTASTWADRALAETAPDLHFVRGYMAYALGRIGRVDDARDIIEDLEERRLRQYVSPTPLFWAYLGMGDLDSAFDWMFEAIDEGALMVTIGMKTQPFYDELRDDPRFEVALDRMGLLEE